MTDDPGRPLPAKGSRPEESPAPLPSAAAPAAAAPEKAPPIARTKGARGPRPELLETREPLYRDTGGYRLRIEGKDLATLRELPGSKGKTDKELGEEFFDGQASRLAAALSEDVPAPAEVRVVVDPYSRQVFLAVGRTIRGIVSF